MTRSGIILIGLISLSLMFAGCASRWQMDKMKDQLDLLTESNQRLEERTAEMDSLLKEQFDLTNRLRADLATILGGMDQRMEIVESKLEDLGQRFPELSRKMEMVKQSLSPAADSGSVSDTSAVKANADPQKLYDASYLDLTRGSYDLAITGFTNYLKYFPETELAGNAQYWLGECYYAKKNFTRSAIEFHKVLENYSTGAKVPSALYKLGLSLIELKSTNQAEKYLNELMEKYPNTQEAKLAEQKLKKIKK
ncbi:MAG TPA: tol-pal system protein YbgF [candidate division Zixibacteria bacterium]